MPSPKLVLILAFWTCMSGLIIPPVRAAEAEKTEPAKEEEKKADPAVARKSKIKKYDEVIPKEAVTKRGLFRVHRVEENLFYEIPTEVLGADLLWVVQISETTAGSSYAGMPAGDRVVRWEQRGEQILLRDVRFGIRAETEDPFATAVRASNLAPIIRVFEVKAYGPDKSPVIDVTDLFKKDVPEFSARNALNAGAMDSARTFIDEFKAFPRNINVKVLASYAPGPGVRAAGMTRRVPAASRL